MVTLGGQPGAGKSRATQYARELHDVELVAINGDDFRALHPEFKRLQRDNPEGMPAVTQAVSGPLVARAVEYAREHRVSVLVEGTFRDPVMVLDTARRFHESGFEVHAVALAVPPEVSRASTLGRFYETLGTDQNRWTPPEAHDAALAAMPATVEALGRSEVVSRVTVLDREGRVLMDGSRPGEARAQSARAVIEVAHSRALTSQERALVSSVTRPATPPLGAQASPAQRSAAQLARAAFGTAATDATKTTPSTPRTAPPRTPPGAMSDRPPGIGD